MSLLLRCSEKHSATISNFSIDHILNVAGKKQSSELMESEDFHLGKKKFEWLNCTRYKPPKLPRQKKKDGVQRRKLGRNPRIPFSSSQVAFLEAKFLQSPYLSTNDVTELASHLKLSETRVKIWFQNRRAREKREKETKSNIVENHVENYKCPEENSTKTKAEINQKLNYFETNFNSSELNKFPTSHFFQLKHINFTPTESYYQLLATLNLKQQICKLK